MICYYNGNILRTETYVKFVRNKALIVTLDVPVDCTFEQLSDVIYLRTTVGCTIRWRVPLTQVHNPSGVLLLYRDQLDAQTLDQVIVYVKVDCSIVISFIFTLTLLTSNVNV